MNTFGDFKLRVTIAKHAALNNGLASDEIKEVILHSVICAGCPPLIGIC